MTDRKEPTFGNFTVAPQYGADFAALSLRDWFAGQALAGFLANTESSGTFRDMADDAYKFADAMLAAREETP